MISEGLLKEIRGQNQERFSDDHFPTRGALAKRYLGSPKYENISLSDFINEFEGTVRFNMVISKENKALRGKTYEEAEIKLINIEDKRKKLFSLKTPIKEKQDLINILLE